MALIQISTELTITFTSLKVFTSFAGCNIPDCFDFIVSILVVKPRKTDSQSCFSFASNRSYQFLNVARSNALISIIISDWILLLHVSMQQEQGMFTTYPSAEGIWDLRARLINISKKINKGRFPFKQNFRKFGSRANGTEISSRKSCQKFRELLNLRNSYQHSNENSRNTESKIEWKAPKVFG